MKRNLALVLPMVLVCLMVAVGSGRAEDSRTVDDSSPQEIVNGMSDKLARGVTNVATGWLELPKQIYMTSKEEGLARGLTVGPIKGIGMTVLRTFSGAGETATFFVAYPGFFAPFFDPPYVWQKE